MATPPTKDISLKLIGISHGGDAIGRHDGLAVFVPYGIPGDTVNVKITENKKRFARGIITEIVEASPDRVTPLCPYFERCGGCHWQHISYPAQITFKQQIVKDTLVRIGGFDNPLVYPTAPNDKPWHYRSHLTFHRDRHGHLGLIATDNKNVISIDDCLIARPEIIDLLHSLKDKTVKSNNDQRMRIQVGVNRHPHAFNLLEDGSANITDAPATIYSVQGHSFRCSPGSFFQADPDQAGKLVEIVLDKLSLQGGEQVYDLFSGVGLFTAFLAERAGHVTSVELSPLAVEDARFNLSAVSNITLIQGGIQESLDSIDIPPSLPVDSIVVDPPRTGIRQEDLDALFAKEPQKIVYVSCDPATLARDSKFIAKNGYKLVDVQPIDMFPQTYHIEAVATFIRS